MHSYVAIMLHDIANMYGLIRTPNFRGCFYLQATLKFNVWSWSQWKVDILLWYCLEPLSAHNSSFCIFREDVCIHIFSLEKIHLHYVESLPSGLKPDQHHCSGWPTDPDSNPGQTWRHALKPTFWAWLIGSMYVITRITCKSRDYKR